MHPNGNPNGNPIVTMLLGAGVSIPAGMASGPDITERVRNGKGVHLHTDGRFYVKP